MCEMCQTYGDAMRGVKFSMKIASQIYPKGVLEHKMLFDVIELFPISFRECKKIGN